jgi:hypothetical protein
MPAKSRAKRKPQHDYRPFAEKYSLPEDLHAQLHNVSWESIVEMAGDFTVVSAESAEQNRKLKKEIEVLRAILLDRIKRASRKNSFDSRLLCDVVRLLERCEAMTGRNELDTNEFRMFLFLIIEKLKREKLGVYDVKKQSIRAPPPVVDFAQLKYKSEE